MSDSLNFRGRTRILNRNYRTTYEVWKAIGPIAEDLQDIDRETLEGTPVFHGEVPTIGYYDNWETEAGIISDWMRKALLEERVPASCGAVLCLTNRDCSRLARALHPALNASAFKSGNLDLGHPGVKVMTMHSAKGLQFPVVAVTGLDSEKMPSRPRGGVDPAEHDRKLRRLFFVACSRAMRQLLVCGNEARPSQYLDLLNSDDWDELDG